LKGVDHGERRSSEWNGTVGQLHDRTHDLLEPRSAGEVSLSRGGKTEILTIHELSPQESAPILKEYVTRESIVRPYFDAQPESGLDAFAAEAPRHPVFLLQE
jgi:hypothetical protein